MNVIARPLMDACVLLPILFPRICTAHWSHGNKTYLSTPDNRQYLFFSQVYIVMFCRQWCIFVSVCEMVINVVLQKGNK